MTFFMCYLNMILNEITSVNIASEVFLYCLQQKKKTFFSFLLTQKHNTAVHLNIITSSAPEQLSKAF